VLKDGGELLLETAVYVDDNRLALLYCPVGSESPHAPDPSSCTFFNVKGLTDTLASFGMVVHKVDLLDKAPRTPNRSGGLRKTLRSLLPAPSPKKPQTTRAVFRCEKRPKGLHTAAGFYWNGKHGFHSGRTVTLEESGIA
jgi:hypothetical protein